MPATLIAPQLASIGASVRDVCQDCFGTGVDTDSDGSITGTVGTLILCECSGGLELRTNVTVFGACDDCDGTGVDVDSDGSITGTVGTVVVCWCSGGLQ